MKHLVWALMILPGLMLVVTSVFLTLVVVGAADGWVPIFALIMWALAAVNLYNEHRHHA